MTEQPITIAGGGERLYGVFHHGQTASPRAVFVFCHPIFEEKKSSHRVLVSTARVLAGRGFAVLRFDYRGCGDSSGEFEQATVGAWLEDVRAAVGFASERAPRCPVGLLGLRFGATLAAQTAEENAAVQVLIAWEPVVNGRSYLMLELRRRLVREMLTGAQPPARRDCLLETPGKNGLRDWDGYGFASTLYNEILGLDLCLEPKRYSGSMLVVEISGRGAVSPPLRRFSDCYRQARVDTLAVRETPFWNAVGAVDCPVLSAETARWIERQLG